jgi:glycosyltransferase involved in cell wall biosynthesis
MKILICSQFYLPKLGGVETSIYHISKSLIKNGHNVDLLTETRFQEEIPNYSCLDRLLHQAGPELARLHSVRRATDIEVYFVIAIIFTYFCRFRQSLRIAAAKLQGQRVFFIIIVEQFVTITKTHRVSRHHFGIKPRALTHQPHEIAVMAVGPIHHGGDGEPNIGRGQTHAAFVAFFEAWGKKKPARFPLRAFKIRPLNDYFLLPAPGNSLNGTFLSTRISCGRPSTCSDTILRKISSVPPAMR